MQASVKTYLSIQYLRAVAAIMVVGLHAGHGVDGLYPGFSNFEVGHAGVDIFFVISGFIMLNATIGSSPGEFLRRRFIRIWPLYAIATLATYAFFTRFDPGAIRAYDASDLIQSLAFIPHDSPRAPGNAWPFLIPGWTLNYEMFFYVIFAIGIWTHRRFSTTAIIILAFMAVGFLIRPTDLALKTYTNPLMLEFLAGMAIARCGDQLPKMAIGMLPLGCVGLFFVHVDSGMRFITMGVPAMMIVAGAIALENRVTLPYLRWLKSLGDASYAIYLFQIIALTMATMALWHLPIRGPLQIVVMILLSVGGSVAAGLIAHSYLERPIIEGLIHRRQNKGVSGPTAASTALNR